MNPAQERYKHWDLWYKVFIKSGGKKICLDEWDVVELVRLEKKAALRSVIKRIEKMELKFEYDNEALDLIALFKDEVKFVGHFPPFDKEEVREGFLFMKGELARGTT